MTILALDIGTSSVKAALIDRVSGALVCPPAREAYPLHQPDPQTAEIVPEELWAAVCRAVRALAPGTSIDGIGLACLTPCLVLLDQAQKPIMPFVTHLDRRARPTARVLDQRFGPAFLSETGNRPLPGGISAVFFKHWSQLHPEILTQVRFYLHLGGWIALQLTGQSAFDPGNAGFTGLCAWTGSGWSSKWCQQFGVLPHWLPPILPGNSTIGGLRSEIAHAWGLKQGIPVKLGLADTSSAILAAGMGPGDLLHSVGTTQVLAVMTDSPRPAPQRLTRHLGVGQSFLHVTHNPVGGAALAWLHELCFRDKPEGEFYGPIIDAALRHQTNVILNPLYLGGDRLEIEERQAGFQGLTLATQPIDLLAALLSGMKLGHRQAWAALECPTPPRRIFISGGGSSVIRRLIPEYAGLPVVELEDAALLGVAKLFD